VIACKEKGANNLVRKKKHLTDLIFPNLHSVVIMNLRKSRILSVFSATVAILAFAVEPVWAVQGHGYPEGLVTHQVGHLLFTGAMIYLLFQLHRIKLSRYDCFEFKIFLWLIIAWNFLTFSGHALDQSIDKTKFIYLNEEVVAFSVESFTDACFYLSRLDHLLLVPSFIFLLLALRKWGQQT